jgi:hypothetical protein
MFGIDMITSYLLVIGLLTLFVAVLVWQRHKSEKKITLWLASGAVGVLLGSIASYGAVSLLGYTVEKDYRRTWPAVEPAEGEEEEDEYAEAGMGEGMGGGTGGGMGGRGGFGGPRPKRDLTNLVRKLELLTGDVAITLSSEQASALATCLADLEKEETMSDDNAQAKHDELLAIMDEDQQSRLKAVGLPRSFGRGGAGGRGGGGGGGGRGGPGGGEQDEDANPFQQDPNAKALAGLRQRLAASE